MNVIYNSDIASLINEIPGLKLIQETQTWVKTNIKSVEAAASNIKFGKLTLNRGPSKDKIDTKTSFPLDRKHPSSRNISPSNCNQASKSKQWFS